MWEDMRVGRDVAPQASRTLLPGVSIEEELSKVVLT